MIAALLDYLAQASALPRPIWALVAGTLASFGITQRLKFAVPPHWSAQSREVAVQSMAFAIGFAVTFFAWDKQSTDALIAAAVVGLWSPALWNVAMLVIGWWRPALRDTLSQNQRVTK